MEYKELDYRMADKAVEYLMKNELDVNKKITSPEDAENILFNQENKTVIAVHNGEIVGGIVGVEMEYRGEDRFVVLHTIIDREFRGGRVLLKLINKVNEISNHKILISFPEECNNKRFKKVTYVYEVI